MSAAFAPGIEVGMTVEFTLDIVTLDLDTPLARVGEIGEVTELDEDNEIVIVASNGWTFPVEANEYKVI